MQVKGSLDFRGYAAARAQACWTSRISSVVAGRGDGGRNRAAMIWRRRLVSMSRVAGSAFDRVPRRRGPAVCDVGAGVAVEGVPDDEQAVAAQPDLDFSPG